MKANPDWRADLAASRDLNPREKQGFEILCSWFENWRLRSGQAPGVEAARAFWKAQVLTKPREQWQLDQWTEAMRWYLGWLDACRRNGGSGKSLPERLRTAVYSAGARRGLALKTREIRVSPRIPTFSPVCDSLSESRGSHFLV
jgi:hypothetical protein